MVKSLSTIMYIMLNSTHTSAQDTSSSFKQW